MMEAKSYDDTIGIESCFARSTRNLRLWLTIFALAFGNSVSQLWSMSSFKVEWNLMEFFKEREAFEGQWRSLCKWSGVMEITPLSRAAQQKTLKERSRNEEIIRKNALECIEYVLTLKWCPQHKIPLSATLQVIGLKLCIRWWQWMDSV